jgi:hypothetical protein
VKTEFKAPWSKTLVATSALTTAVVLVASLVALRTTFMGALIPVGVLVGAALLTVRGYDVTAKHIAIKRLLWSTELPRVAITDVRIIDHVSPWGYRVFGNGGAFAFSGLFWNKELGWFRAFMTRNKGVVLIKYEHRKVAVSPDDPERFVRALDQ